MNQLQNTHILATIKKKTNNVVAIGQDMNRDAFGQVLSIPYRNHRITASEPFKARKDHRHAYIDRGKDGFVCNCGRRIGD